MSAILSGIVEEAERLLDAASGDGTTLALLGGVAVRLMASDVPASLHREYKDIDFAAPKGSSSAAAKLLSGQGYEPAVASNAMNGRDRLLFFGHEGADRDGDAINGARIAELCGNDWGLWRTITRNLERCRELAGNYELSAEDAQRIASRIEQLLAEIEDRPKSRGWRLRARVGERKRWYELPEEVDR